MTTIYSIGIILDLILYNSWLTVQNVDSNPLITFSKKNEQVLIIDNATAKRVLIVYLRLSIILFLIMKQKLVYLLIINMKKTLMMKTHLLLQYRTKQRVTELGLQEVA